MRWSWSFLGLSVLLASGLAWVAASLYYQAWEEAIYCGLIGGGYGAATLGSMPPARRRLFGAGFLIAALGNGIPAADAVAVYGLGWDSAWSVLMVVGLAVAGVASLRMPARAVWPPALRVGMAIVALGAILLVVGSDLYGLSWWTPGNLLVLVGAGGLAAMPGQLVAPSPPS